MCISFKCLVFRDLNSDHLTVVHLLIQESDYNLKFDSTLACFICCSFTSIQYLLLSDSPLIDNDITPSCPSASSGPVQCFE